MAAPWFTAWVDCSIRAEVSLAASADLLARLRTSSATTAKPLPAFPARAASTAAFSASILVWKAISLIVFTIFQSLPTYGVFYSWRQSFLSFSHHCCEYLCRFHWPNYLLLWLLVRYVKPGLKYR